MSLRTLGFCCVDEHDEALSGFELDADSGKAGRPLDRTSCHAMCAMAFSLQWDSEDARHTDQLVARELNLWHDVLPFELEPDLRVEDLVLRADGAVEGGVRTRLSVADLSGRARGGGDGDDAWEAVLERLGMTALAEVEWSGDRAPALVSASVADLDLAAIGRLEFREPDLARFPCLDLALQAAAEGGAAGDGGPPWEGAASPRSQRGL